MTRVASLYQTTIGKKVVMALSGVVWFGYVIGHLAGNLLVYAGPDAINRYSAFLHDSPVILWGTRLLLVVSIVAHVVASTQLTLQNAEARPVAYFRRDDLVTSYAARTMVWSGPLIALFIVYHLAHLTLGIAPGTEFDAHHVYNNVVRGFQLWWLAAIYVASVLALGFHLFHGAWSFLQTLGANHPKYNPWRRHLAVAVTVLVVAGYLSIPVSVMTGVLEPALPATAAAE